MGRKARVRRTGNAARRARSSPSQDQEPQSQRRGGWSAPALMQHHLPAVLAQAGHLAARPPQGALLVDRAPLVRSAVRPILALDDPAGAPGAVAQAGVDPTLEERALQDALRSAIATRRGSCSWDVDHAGWVVTLHSPEEQTYYGKTLEAGLAWCLVGLMAPELGGGDCRQPWGDPRVAAERTTAATSPGGEPHRGGDGSCRHRRFREDATVLSTVPSGEGKIFGDHGTHCLGCPVTSGR